MSIEAIALMYVVRLGQIGWTFWVLLIGALAPVVWVFQTTR